MTRIDAHQHFWRTERGDYGWLTPELTALYRDFLPNDLAPLLERAGIEGTVLVQAAPTVAETRFLLGIAEANDFVRGVVGWVDFAAPDAPDRIAELAGNPKLKGLRPMIQDIADTEWMLRADLTPAYEALIARDLVFDALVKPPHLEPLARLLARDPEMRVVIDHCAKPEIADGALDDWAVGMTRLARESAGFCKLSGLVTEAEPDWSVETLRPYVDHVLAEFGPGRMIWGSDWPVCTLAASYEDWVEATEALLAGCDADERAAIMGGNAERVYRL